ncbi:hypothetical protein C8J56DRAFT_1117353 [Mycena floridula]|nr:hypothetical protein C8J56DRAFT_1117353 [Mycena floridula]
MAAAIENARTRISNPTSEIEATGSRGRYESPDVWEVSDLKPDSRNMENKEDAMAKRWEFFAPHDSQKGNSLHESSLLMRVEYQGRGLGLNELSAIWVRQTGKARERPEVYRGTLALLPEASREASMTMYEGGTIEPIVEPQKEHEIPRRFHGVTERTEIVASRFEWPWATPSKKQSNAISMSKEEVNTYHAVAREFLLALNLVAFGDREAGSLISEAFVYWFCRSFDARADP